MATSYAVKEMFYSLQGEGRHSGRPPVFCRFAGCNLWSGRERDRATAACNFCDTDFVGVDGAGGGQFQNSRSLAKAIDQIWGGGSADGRFVVLTGGEPLLQVGDELVSALHDLGFEIALETNGTLAAPRLIDWITVSPKGTATLAQTAGNKWRSTSENRETPSLSTNSAPPPPHLPSDRSCKASARNGPCGRSCAGSSIQRSSPSPSPPAPIPACTANPSIPPAHAPQSPLPPTACPAASSTNNALQHPSRPRSIAPPAQAKKSRRRRKKLATVCTCPPRSHRDGRNAGICRGSCGELALDSSAIGGTPSPGSCEDVCEVAIRCHVLSPLTRTVLLSRTMHAGGHSRTGVNRLRRLRRP